MVEKNLTQITLKWGFVLLTTVQVFSSFYIYEPISQFGIPYTLKL